MKALLALLILSHVTFFEALANPSTKEGFHWDVFSQLAIQDRGRLKPMNTFARETLQYVTSRSHWKGLKAEAVIFGWMAQYEEEWNDTPFILVDYKPLKRELGLPEKQKYFPPSALLDLPALSTIVRTAFEKKRDRQSLSEIEKKAQTVQSRLGLVQAIVSGRLLTLLPNPKNINGDWFALSDLPNEKTRTQLPYPPETLNTARNFLTELVEAYMEGDAAKWNETWPKFAQFLRADLSQGNYPTESELSREIHYNHLRPFRWAWILYTLSFLLLLTHIVTQKKALSFTGIFTLATGFAIHSYGFVLRCLIAGRPPVTNMYESVIWVSWGCILFSFMIWLAYKQIVILTAATAFGVVSLILADTLPSILDPSINPLEPVLRSNFWLTIHVLTITLSYAAFALSLCLGNVVIGNHAFTPTRTDRMKQYSLYMYRSMQIGVVLLAAGTILGGVWADYSWGRFWGWDPKEVWALIALLMYLAVLHGRFTGWLKGFGFAAVTVLSFLGVLMAWYGVNFVLGAGLHSYGFGTGGTGYVGAYIFAQLAFIGFGYMRHRSAIQSHTIDTSIFPKGQR